MSRGKKVVHFDRLARAYTPPWWTIPGYCRCGRPLLMAQNEGTCLRCGTGQAALRVTPVIQPPHDYQQAVRESALKAAA